MKFKYSKVCLAIFVSLTPSLSSLAGEKDTNKNTVEVAESNPGSDVHGNDWKSIEIGTTQFTAKDELKGINFDHGSPIAKGRNAIAIGTSAEAGTLIQDEVGFKTGESIAIGAKAKATKEQSIAIGGDTVAEGWGAIVIGGDDLTPLKGRKYGEVTIPDNYEASTASGDGSIVLGAQSKARGDLSLAVGAVSQAVGLGATAMGATSVATGNRSNAIGYNAKVEAEDGIAFGTYSKVSGVGSVNSIAMGLSANTDKKSAIAIGQNAKVTLGDGSVAIGSNSEDKKATAVSKATINLKNGNSVEYSGFAGDKPTSVVSVGSAGNERQIVNVGAGDISEASTDAINGSQLYAIAKTLKDDLDAINPTWKLKDSTGKEKEVGSKNGGATGNEVTVTGKGDIDVAVDGNGLSIDGTKLAENIKKDAIKIKTGDGQTLTKKLGEEVEFNDAGPIKTKINNNKLEITAETASFTPDVNGGNGKIT
ncbi:hemagglutinin, partial [Escherichia coli]|nr:hemagglutinin [Escherichia coli]